MIDFEVKDTRTSVPMVSIKVVGVGGAGGNTVNSIMSTCEETIEFIVANTDAQALELARASKKIRLGIKSTRGLGTGADPEQGKRAAEEDLDKVLEAVEGADIVFLTGGMGGGTGSGSLPVIARALKEKNILTIAIVTKPFIFEGRKRQVIAEQAIEKLRNDVDILIVIPNQKLLDVVDQKVSMIDAFAMINEVLGQSVKAISDIITKAGHINVDFADVRTIVKSQGLAVMGTARTSGANRAQEAARKAISSPLLENMSIEGASRVLLNITGGTNLSLYEISEAASIVYGQVDEQAQIILGSVIDPSMENEVAVTIIATGFNTPIRASSVATLAVPDEHSVSSGSVQASSERVAQVQAPACVVQESVNEVQQVSNPVVWTDAEHTEKMEKRLTEQHQMCPKTDLDLTDLDIPTFMRVSGELQKR